MQRYKILLIGNGPFLNRGCEAIYRGTKKILEKTFGNEVEIIQLNYRKYSLSWFECQIKKKLFYYNYSLSLAPIIKDIDLVLDIGGDNFTFDYGVPYEFVYNDSL